MVYFDKPEGKTLTTFPKCAKCINLFWISKDVEVMMTSPHSIDKGSVYKIVEDVIDGDGLFSMGGRSYTKF